MTTDLNTFDGLLVEVERTSDEIRRLKEAMHMQMLRSPELDTAGLEAAIQYWAAKKQELEDKLRTFR